MTRLTQHFKWLLLGLMWVAGSAQALPKPSAEAVREYAPVRGTGKPEKWVVYQRGTRLTLAIDENSIVLAPDGLVYFSHEERFPKVLYDKHMNVHFQIRRTRVVGNCVQDKFAFIRSDFFDKDRKPVFSGMFDLQKHQWEFIDAYMNSIGEAMLTTACSMAEHPAYTSK